MTWRFHCLCRSINENSTFSRTSSIRQNLRSKVQLYNPHPHPLFLPIPLISSYQAPKAVQAWKSELTSKKRTKIAAMIAADPSSNPDLFEEGWEEVSTRGETHGPW